MPRKPPFTEVVSARRSEALAGGEDGRGDFGEGEVLGRAAGALFPVEEELAVAVGEAGGGVDVEDGQGAVDPVGGAFEFGVGADGGLVEDEVGRGVGGGVEDGELGAVLLVDEGGAVAELGEDLGKGVRVGDGGLGLDADLVAGGVGVGGVVDALVGEGVDAAVFAEAKDLAFERGGRGWECRRGCCVRRCEEFRDGSRGAGGGTEGLRGSETGNFSSISAACMGGVYG